MFIKNQTLIKIPMKTLQKIPIKSPGKSTFQDSKASFVSRKSPALVDTARCGWPHPLNQWPPVAAAKPGQVANPVGKTGWVMPWCGAMVWCHG